MSAPPGSGRSGEPTDPAAAGAGADDDAGLQRATERALADLLTAHGWHDPVVAITGAASVGAQRSTLLIDIESEDEIIPAVAQLSSGIIAADCAARIWRNQAVEQTGTSCNAASGSIGRACTRDPLPTVGTAQIRSRANLKNSRRA